MNPRNRALCFAKIMGASKVFILFLFLVSSCNKENAPDIIKSTGKETSQVRNLDAFKKIVVLDEFDIELVYDSVNKVEITFGKNLIDNVLSEVNNGILTFENGNKFNWVRKLGQRIKVKLHCYEIDVLV